MKTKCNKCDERGYITTISDNGMTQTGSSCECGWAIEQSARIFDKDDESNYTYEELNTIAMAKIAGLTILRRNEDKEIEFMGTDKQWNMFRGLENAKNRIDNLHYND